MLNVFININNRRTYSAEQTNFYLKRYKKYMSQTKINNYVYYLDKYLNKCYFYRSMD